MTKIINILGGPGISKSTTSAGVFSLLKLHKIECELVPEYAKELVWEERKATLEDQQYVFGKQQHRLSRLKGKVDVIITDCPLILNIVYGRRYKTGTDQLYLNVINTIKSYNNINVVLDRVKEYNPNGRNETKAQAECIDREIINALKEYDLDFITLPGTFKAINEIVAMVLDQDLKYKVVEAK